MNKHIVTARIDDQQYYINCKDFSEAFNVAGRLHNIELKEHNYTQIRLRSSIPSISKGYRWISLVKWV